jgi:hypothetical protein
LRYCIQLLNFQKSLPEQLYPYYQVGDQLLPYSPMFNATSMTVGPRQQQQAQQAQMQQSQTKSLSRPRQVFTIYNFDSEFAL